VQRGERLRVGRKNEGGTLNGPHNAIERRALECPSAQAFSKQSLMPVG
jgi:hypothetical protein